MEPGGCGERGETVWFYRIPPNVTEFIQNVTEGYRMVCQSWYCPGDSAVLSNTTANVQRGSLNVVVGFLAGSFALIS